MIARVVEWQTRTTQNRVPKGMGVRLSPWAPRRNLQSYSKIVLIFLGMLVEKFDKFLQLVNLMAYRDKYRPIKIVEMDMPREVQAINMLYKVYWDQKKFLPFKDFYKEYLN